MSQHARSPPSAILVVDGLFLHRPELVGYWDLSIFLVADQRRETAWQDYLTAELPVDEAERTAEVERRINRARRERYAEGQAIYEREANPGTFAHFVVDNDDLAAPRVLESRPLQ